jgi:hypothetical protein
VYFCRNTKSFPCTRRASLCCFIYEDGTPEHQCRDEARQSQDAQPLRESSPRTSLDLSRPTGFGVFSLKETAAKPLLAARSATQITAKAPHRQRVCRFTLLKITADSIG